MQRAYIGKLMELAEKDSNIIQILADSGTNLDETFKRNFPEQILNFGIAEQNTVGVAAGMAMVGYIPFVFLQGAFITYRAMEFVRNDICFHNVNVKLVGQGSGLSLSGLGPSHHTTEELSILRALPNLNIFSPATPVQTRELTEHIYYIKEPCYLRLGMNNETEFFDDNYKLNGLGYDILRDGKDVCIVSTGSIIEETMHAAELLSDKGISTKIISIYQIKPFKEDEFIDIIKGIEYVFVVEEHQIYGGLASCIIECLSKRCKMRKVIPIGLYDTFAVGFSNYQKKVRQENLLDSKSIGDRILKEIENE